MVLLKDLNDHTDRWSIVVRVMRKWHVHQKASPNDFVCSTMILVDREVVYSVLTSFFF